MKMQELHAQYHGNYGSRRMMAALNHAGFEVGRYRVRRLMKQLGLSARYPKRFKVTTDSAHHQPVAENVLDRNFTVSEPNRVWTTDITYLWTHEGWLYIAIVVDLFSRQIVGWSVKEHMRTGLCLDALDMAWWRRKKPKGVLHHSDRGSQYASQDYQHRLKDYDMTVSMSRKGNCWDNSPTDRVFRTLKSEYLDRFNFQTKSSAKQAVWHYISYYNSNRSHSVLGYVSPMQFEKQSAMSNVS